EDRPSRPDRVRAVLRPPAGARRRAVPDRPRTERGGQEHDPARAGGPALRHPATDPGRTPAPHACAPR
ncbi:MAG: hypothetical protein AVDCRST_MAG79-2143, partial [uncultured Thermoleophilia bacterium]